MGAYTSKGLEGPAGPAGPQGEPGPPGIATTYVHTQLVATDVWVIDHGLGKYPSVVCIDSAGDEIKGETSYSTNNQVTVTFSSATGGVAYCN